MYRDIGLVDYERSSGPGGERHRFRWKTDSAGESVLAVPSMSGVVLVEAIVSHGTSGSGAFSIALLDELGVDLLDSQLSSLSLGSSTIRALLRVVSSGAAKWSRPLRIMSPEVFFRVTHTASGTYSGVIDFYAERRDERL